MEKERLPRAYAGGDITGPRCVTKGGGPLFAMP